MAKKIPIRVYIGVTPMPLAVGLVLSGMLVTVTEEGSGALHSASIPPDAMPTPDAGGNPHFEVDFPLVQSGEQLHVAVGCLDGDGTLIGAEVTHNVFLDEVPDDPPPGTFLQPVSIYLTPI